MELQENPIKFIIIHPILIALYPVFFVYSQNIHLILIQGIIFPVLIILGITIAMWAITRSILKNTRKSALLTSLFVFLFFSYGHIFNFLESNLNQEYSFLQRQYLIQRIDFRNQSVCKDVYFAFHTIFQGEIPLLASFLLRKELI